MQASKPSAIFEMRRRHSPTLSDWSDLSQKLQRRTPLFSSHHEHGYARCIEAQSVSLSVLTSLLLSMTVVMLYLCIVGICFLRFMVPQNPQPLESMTACEHPIFALTERQYRAIHTDSPHERATCVRGSILSQAADYRRIPSAARSHARSHTSTT